MFEKAFKNVTNTKLERRTGTFWIRELNFVHEFDKRVYTEAYGDTRTFPGQKIRLNSSYSVL